MRFGRCFSKRPTMSQTLRPLFFILAQVYGCILRARMASRLTLSLKSVVKQKGKPMPTIDSIFHHALSKMLVEIFDGPPTSEAYLLNPGDPGLLRQIDS